MDGRNILDILVETQKLNPGDVEKVKKEASLSGGSIIETLARLGFLTEEEAARALSKKYGIPYVNLDELEIDPSLSRFLPVDYVRKNLVVPIKRKGKRLSVAVVDPSIPLSLIHI